jgi:predicted HTH transcriptional regulator
MGTGIGDMIRRCRETGLREPKFEMADGFTLTLGRIREASAGAGTSGKTSGKISGETSGMMSGIASGKMSGKIVRLMLEKPDITIPEIARRLKRTTRAIEMQIHRLKADEFIGRIGPAKGGHWEVLR